MLATMIAPAVHMKAVTDGEFERVVVDATARIEREGASLADLVRSHVEMEVCPMQRAP
ncbi:MULTISPECIES: hypothetical protein [Paraburkholderia]|uniref:hypothetical protein n=1 Tax=Paraburkholderia TaxID=1822464 RepID=UPI0015955250|nr:hypothetical protein [Paraburkholderia youngii]